MKQQQKKNLWQAFSLSNSEKYKENEQLFHKIKPDKNPGRVNIYLMIWVYGSTALQLQINIAIIQICKKGVVKVFFLFSTNYWMPLRFKNLLFKISLI